jgi:hypothetical protein
MSERARRDRLTSVHDSRAHIAENIPLCHHTGRISSSMRTSKRKLPPHKIRLCVWKIALKLLGGRFAMKAWIPNIAAKYDTIATETSVKVDKGVVPGIKDMR